MLEDALSFLAETVNFPVSLLKNGCILMTNFLSQFIQHHFDIINTRNSVRMINTFYVFLASFEDTQNKT